MKNFIHGIILIVLILFCAIAFAQEIQCDRLEKLVGEALQKNPQLQAAKYTTSAVRAQIRQRTAWSPPQFGVEFYQTPIRSFPNPIKDGMETDYFVQQMLPFPGKLSAMGKAAQGNARMIAQEYQALEKKIIRELKSAYYELYLIQHKIEINKETQELLRRFSEIARKMYEVGIGNQVDALRAQTELSLLINQGVNLQLEKKSISAMLNTLLSRPPDRALGEIAEIDVKHHQWTLEQLKPLAEEHRAELQAMKYNIEMNKAELRLAKREYFPDLMVQVMYKDMKMTGDDFWSTMLGMNIPLALWSSGKYKGQVEENKLKLMQAEEEYRSMSNMVFTEIQEAVIKIESHYNSMQLYDQTVIPQAEQTLQSTIAAYQTGKTDFLMLLDSYRMLLMSKLDYYMAKMNYLSSQAALEQAVGLSIAEIEEKLIN